MKRILIMGLPGAGKTTLAQAVRQELWQLGCTVTWLNADEIRELHDDWDFSTAGRIRQSIRMQQAAEASTDDYVLADFVAPLPQQRDTFAADFTVWVNTIAAGRFEDTNTVFVPPAAADVCVTTQDSVYWAELIVRKLHE